jgi:hypothetical protein
MSKKSTKTIEQLTEEFFAAERAEYEKRVPAAFPRVETAAPAEPAVEEEKRSGGEEETRGGGDAATRS